MEDLLNVQHLFVQGSDLLLRAFSGTPQFPLPFSDRLHARLDARNLPEHGVQCSGGRLTTSQQALLPD
jgi:hypothetical protein